ncbi:hypothetical protein FISHEDRAFT_59741 [Fistulina hepatica ATCC 64428]|uniref:mRNA-decapping enzyme C-terminal domain-containing protein n=1 Tax=Fistulina hepatica ATCC 64428 TaxID=1128425 RepID=A0A0D7A9I4_9AGAR|nr:hypothetical protein FISHEDRAFT_59741 [Fistulina hepatica ATCC 64428]
MARHTNGRSARIDPQQQQRPVAQAVSYDDEGEPAVTVSKEARYQSNLRRLRRRDPAIESIFCQFSHVCVFHSPNGTEKKWEKRGYEGAMFLYERSAYPPYGIYVLNRQGLVDFMQNIYPEDKMGPDGALVGIRQYPRWTQARIQKVHEKDPHADRFSPLFKLDPAQKLPAEVDDPNEPSQLVGLWCEDENLLKILLRLQYYIKQCRPYPKKYRYPICVDCDPRFELKVELDFARTGRNAVAVNGLFAKMNKSATKMTAESSAQGEPVTASSSSPTLDAMFANMQQCTPTSGPDLLKSIFDSARTTPAAVTQPEPTPTPPATAIHATAAPHVLTQNVLSTLLFRGSPSSSTQSATHSSSQEGDDEGGSSAHVLDSDSSYLSFSFTEDSDSQSVDVSQDARPAFLQDLFRSASGAPTSAAVHSSSSVATLRQPDADYHHRDPSISSDLPQAAGDFPDGEGGALSGTSANGSGDGDGDGDVILELDFADTSALSDPEAFNRKAMKNRKNKKAKRGVPAVDASSVANGYKGKSKAGDYSHFIPDVRQQQRDSIKAQIFQDFRETAGSKANFSSEDSSFSYARAPNSGPATPSPGSSRDGSPIMFSPPFASKAPVRIATVASAEIKPPVAEPTPPSSLNSIDLFALLDLKPPNVKPSPPVSNGVASGAVSKTNGNGVAPSTVVSTADVQTTAPTIQPCRTDSDTTLRNILIDSILAQAQMRQTNPPLAQKDLMRTLMTLIHTDKSFVDSLYQEYLRRAG